MKYELSRFNAWIGLAPYLKNETVVDIYRFPWEEIKKGRIIDGTTNAISKIKPAT